MKVKDQKNILSQRTQGTQGNTISCYGARDKDKSKKIISHRGTGLTEREMRKIKTKQTPQNFLLLRGRPDCLDMFFQINRFFRHAFLQRADQGCLSYLSATRDGQIPLPSSYPVLRCQVHRRRPLTFHSHSAGQYVLKPRDGPACPIALLTGAALINWGRAPTMEIIFIYKKYSRIESTTYSCCSGVNSG